MSAGLASSSVESPLTSTLYGNIVPQYPKNAFMSPNTRGFAAVSSASAPQDLLQSFLCSSIRSQQNCAPDFRSPQPDRQLGVQLAVVRLEDTSQDQHGPSTASSAEFVRLNPASIQRTGDSSSSSAGHHAPTHRSPSNAAPKQVCTEQSTVPSTCPQCRKHAAVSVGNSCKNLVHALAIPVEMLNVHTPTSELAHQAEVQVLVQEVTFRELWRQDLEQLRTDHTRSACALLAKQQQELADLLSQHNRQRSDQHAAFQAQCQERGQKRDQQLQRLQAFQHALSRLPAPNGVAGEMSSDHMQESEERPSCKRRRSPTSPTSSSRPGKQNGEVELSEPGMASITQQSDDAHRDFGSQPLPSRNGHTTNSSACTGFLSRTLRAASDRLWTLEEAAQNDEMAEDPATGMHVHDLEVEKLRQQKHHKRLLLFSLHTERLRQRSVRRRLGNGSPQRDSTADNQLIDSQRHLSAHIQQRVTLLQELRAERHRIGQVQQYRRRMHAQADEADGNDEDASSASSSTDFDDDEDMLEEHHTEDIKPPPEPHTAKKEHTHDDHGVCKDNLFPTTEPDPDPDPIQALLCMKEECLAEYADPEMGSQAGGGTFGDGRERDKHATYPRTEFTRIPLHFAFKPG